MSVDALLNKYDKLPSVARLKCVAREQCEPQENIVMRVNGGNPYNQKNQNSQKLFCPGCFYLGNRVSAKVSFKHFPTECPQSAALVALVEAAEDTGTLCQFYQKDIENVSQERLTIPALLLDKRTVKPNNKQTDTNGNNVIDTDEICQLVFCLESKVQSSAPPALSVKIKSLQTIAIIDEGSELNCLDTNFANSCGIRFTDTKLSAKSAGSVNIKMRDQTDEAVLVDILTSDFTSTISLSVCVIIDNLGTDVLMGQPAKVNHQIETKPHMGVVQFKDLNGCDRMCAME